MFQRCGFDLFVVVTHDTGSGDDEDEFQVVAQRRQGFELVASTADFDSGLQCRANLAGFALGFQGLGDIGARGADQAPLGEQLALAGQFRQIVPELEHDRIVCLASQHGPDFLGGE